MKKILKRVALALLAIIVIGGIVMYIVVSGKTGDFDASMDKVYDVPLPVVTKSTDDAVLARGKHLMESVGACASTFCHGPDYAGGKTIKMGPVATLTGPNITAKGMGAVYTDAEMARLLRHGIKKDGRSIRFMPVQDFDWLSDADLTAIISYWRTVPAVDKANGSTEVKTLGKVLDRKDQGLIMDVARRIDHKNVQLAPPASPTKEYGAYVTRLCTGCHGEHYSGGAIPGAPSDIPIPLNITPDATGIQGWTYEDFDKLLTQGVRKNGQQLKTFMPIEAFGKMDETEKKAMYAYLMSLPPTPFGGR